MSNSIINSGGDKLENGKDELSKFISSEVVTNVIIKKSDEYDADYNDEEERPNLQGDRANVMLLTLLYFMQGIVSGLSLAMPLLLLQYGASYTQQAKFSMAVWPFSLKLIWAPIIDSLYSKRFGRRKSWLIPTQFLTGIFMLMLSYYVELWLSGDGQKPNIEILTMLYFGLNFLAASQDIIVDGWSVQLVKRRNVGYIATCNQCGQKTGVFVGFALFTALESAEFCNKYLRNDPQPFGLVKLSGFLFFWGICYLSTTLLIAIFKKEHPQEHSLNENSEFNLVESYKVLLDILKLPGVKVLVIILLTSKFGYAFVDNVAKLKLLEAGVPKDNFLILIMLTMLPTEIIVPLIVTKYTTGPKPTETFIKFIPFRLICSVCAALIVWLTPNLINGLGQASFILLFMLLINNILYDTCVNSMYLGMTAFFARVSDPRVGGTYMTLWNTVENLGGTWPGTISLWMVDILTWKECDSFGISNKLNSSLSVRFCNSTETVNCTMIPTSDESELNCKTTVDGFYVEAVICIIYGIAWYFWGKSKIRYLQRLPTSVWRLNNKAE